MRIAICIIFVLCLGFSPLRANDISVIKSASNNKFTSAPQGKTARDLVQWYRLSLSKDISFRTGAAFIRQHPTWPSLRSIKKNTEAGITSSIPSAEIIQYFTKTAPVTARGMTHYLNALIATGRTAQALPILRNWFPDGLMAPNDQRDVITRFGKYLGSQDFERRLNKIIPGKHYTAARQLAKRLGKGYPQLVEAKIALLEQKPNVNALISKIPARLKNNEALLFARLQWRRKNKENGGAIQILNKAPAYNRLSSPKAWWKERHIMARRLIEEKKWGTAYRLVRDHRQKEGFPLAQAEFVAGWIALRKIGKPWEAFEHFERLFNAVKSPISRARGAYWAGLASDALKHPEVAVQWYQVAAKYQTTYYGQMAAARINLPLGLINPTPIAISKTARQSFKANNLVSAVLLLKRAGQIKDAKKFLNAYIDSTKSGLGYSLIAELASSLGLREVAVRSAKTAERKGYIMPTYLFPILKQTLKRTYAVHPAFIHGIIRQESMFDQRAKSRSGALGLMQLMPATAKETAQRAGLRHSRAMLTSNPSHNMTLGSLYIKQMMEKWDGNRTLAIASYNAGPGRVSQWVKEFGDPRTAAVDEVDWVETIPVYETRNYVQRVTESLNVYARLLK